jgi:hypothetical protein
MSISIPVQVTLKFRRSSFCGHLGCIEVAMLPCSDIALRDSKDNRADAPVLRFTTEEWEAFLNGVLAGEFAPSTLAANR